LRVESFGREVIELEAMMPARSGRYRAVAELRRSGCESVRSRREFEVLTEADIRARRGLAVGRPVRASSSFRRGAEQHPAELAVDGDTATRWSSEFADPQWLAVDLGEPVEIARVELVWEAAYGKDYAIEVSTDGETWHEVHRTKDGDGGLDAVRFAPTRARWVRMRGARRGTRFGYSLWEFRVFGH
jgi:hypothetical protein